MNIINPSGVCKNCGGPCETWKTCCTLRCRDEAKYKRRLAREQDRRLVERASATFAESAPYPLADSESLALLSQLLVEGKVQSPVEFENVDSGVSQWTPKNPRLRWEVLPNGRGKLSLE